MIYYAEKNQYSIIENPFKDTGNSGIQLVDFLRGEKVTTIITGEVGPKVSAMLEKEKFQLVLLPEERIKVEEIMDRIKP